VKEDGHVHLSSLTFHLAPHSKLKCSVHKIVSHFPIHTSPFILPPFLDDFQPHRQKPNNQRIQKPVGSSGNMISMINRPKRSQESSIARKPKTQPSEGPPNHNIEDPDPSGVSNQSQMASPSAETPSPSASHKRQRRRRASTSGSKIGKSTR